MKRVVTGLALALAVQAFADHPQTINKTGFVGVNRTQSAQSLGHAKLSFYGLVDATTDVEYIAPYGVRERYNVLDENLNLYNNIKRTGMVEDYIALGAQIGFGIGLWNIVDLGVGIPVYYDKFVVNNSAMTCPHPIGQVVADSTTGDVWECNEGQVPATDIGYIGNIKGNVKIRIPLPDEQPFDIAIFGEGDFGTANPAKDGLWIREAEFINKTDSTAQGYGTRSTVIKGGLALTLDFDKIDAVPLLIHGNGGYVYSMNQDYLSYWYATGAMEIYFASFLSIFGEYYMILPFMQDPYADGVKLDVKDLTGAIVFHLPIGLDIHLGGSYSLSSSDSTNFTMVRSMEIEGSQNPSENRMLEYKTNINPKYKVYGGITWSGFLVAQDRDGDGVKDNEDRCPDDFGHRLNQGCPLGNPDADEDGVCDSWVAEKGFESEFQDVCEGIDACPNEAGEGEDGCPLDEPDPDKDGVCDAWVAKKKMQKKFKDVCQGIDSCPDEKGTVANKGCPEDNPDPDADGMCSPWVTDKNKLGEYAGVCKGYDMCPGEAGPKANKGCPWDDPDSDGDGLCDEWVTQKKMGFYFEKAAEDDKIKNEWFIEKTCKGIDKCPTEFGPANNEGCPLGDPDTDKDGICDEWVSQKNMLDQYDGLCAGIDKCPTEPGEAWANGCPMDNPDIDGDSLCAGWVTEKNMQKQFKDICHGIDKCPTENGPEWNKGCPAENPDSDGDGLCDAWVSKQKMFDQFKDICKGIDRCPDEPGPEWAKGCPSDDNPDTDGDGLCDAWVSKQKVQDQFKDICKGIDKCEDEPGPEWSKGCPADNPDSDGDGLCDAWVAKKKMFDQFKDVCHGTDKCPDEAGPEWNKGCALDDDPDADKDGVCSEWVSTKKLLNQFKDVCSGIDRCPDVPGDDGHGCPKKAVEKLTGVTFKPGKATLESNARNILKGVAKKLVEDDSYKDLKIVIQGHTDNKGKEKTNQKLSQKRADEVKKTLTKFGVKKDRIKSVGLGSTCPVDDNETADGREMNRRIEMHFVTPDNDGTKCESNYSP